MFALVALAFPLLASDPIFGCVPPLPNVAVSVARFSYRVAGPFRELRSTAVLAMIEKLPEYDPTQASAREFFVPVGVGAILNEAKHRRVGARIVCAPIDDESATADADSFAEIEALLMSATEGRFPELLRAAFAGLSPQARRVITLRFQRGDGWEASRIVVGRKTTTIVAANRAYAGRTARGIGIGTAEDDVRKAYGEPARIVPSRQGFHAVYGDSGIVFSYETVRGVSGWFLFEVH